jgi:hypothetical protein
VTPALRMVAVVCILIAGVRPTAAAAGSCPSVVDPGAVLDPSSRLDGAIAALGRLDVTVLVTAGEPGIRQATPCANPGRPDLFVHYDPATEATSLSTELRLGPGLRHRVEDTMRRGLRSTDPASAIAQGLELLWQSLERTSSPDGSSRPGGGAVAAVPALLAQDSRPATTLDPFSRLLGAARRLVAVIVAAGGTVTAFALAGVVARRRQARRAARQDARAARQLLAESYFDLDARMAEVAVVVDAHHCDGPSNHGDAAAAAVSARVAAVQRVAIDVELILLRPEPELTAAACNDARLQLESALSQLGQLVPADA